MGEGMEWKHKGEDIERNNWYERPPENQCTKFAIVKLFEVCNHINEI